MIGFLLLLFRSYIKEHPVTKGRTVSEVATDSVRDKGAIVQGLVVACLLVLVFYGSLIYVNELVHQRLEIPRSEIFHANSLLLGLWILLPPCVGYLTDKYQLSYHQVMRFGALGVFFSAPLLGLALVRSSYPAVLAAQGLMHLFHMLFCICTPRFFGDLFTGHARNTAISTSYSMGASFTSALAPMICHGSILVFQTSFAICVPFMVMALATILCS